MKRIGLVLVVALAALMAVPTAMAAETYSLFGDAEIVAPGNASPKSVQLRSDATPGWGGVDFVIPAGTTFADLTTLSTDYMFEADDSCGNGSPRFQINVDSGSGDTGSIFVYIGPSPNYTLCPSSVWQNTGDLLEGTNPIDTTQLDSGAFYDPYTTALGKYGNYTVTGVQVVVDAGYAFTDQEQTVFIDTTNVAGTIYTYETTADLFEDVREATIDLVDNRKAEWTLLAALDRAERFNDAGQPNVACGAMFNYTYLVNLYETFGVITSETAEELLARAEPLAEAVCE